MSIKYRIAEVSHLGDLHTLYDITQYSWSGSTISFTLNDGSIHQFNSHKTDRIVLYKAKNSTAIPTDPEPTDPVNPDPEPTDPTDPVDPEPTDPVNPDPTAPEGVIVQVVDFDELESNASVTVETTRSQLKVAPDGVYFNVTDYSGFDTPNPAGPMDYSRPYHELLHIVDFDDPDYQWTHPVNVKDSQRNANISYGPTFGHTYTKPGTYNPKLVVYERGSGKVAKIDLGPIEVADPEVMFAGSGTVYVAPSGDFSNAPEGSVQFDALYDALRYGKSENPRRYMLGEEVVEMGGIQLDGYGSTKIRNIYICSAPGIRAKIVNPTSNPTFSLVDKLPRVVEGDGLDFVLNGVDVEGGWDASTETGLDPNGIQVSPGGDINFKVNYILLNDVVLSGFHQSVVFLGRSHEAAFEHDITSIYNDMTITNWRDYAIFSGTLRMALLGCRMTQHEDAMSGGFKNGAHNQHGVLRINGVNHGVMDGCDFFTYNGWWQNVSPYHTQQPVLRWNFMGHDDVHPMALNYQRCSAEGGLTILAFQHMNDPASVRNNNVLIEQSYFLGTHMTTRAITAEFGGITFRNCFVFFPNIPRILFDNLFDPGELLAYDNQGLPETNQPVDPFVIENITAVNFMETGNYSEGSHPAIIPFNNITWPGDGNTVPARLNEDELVTIRNNIIHEPNLDNPQVEYAPFDVSQVLWAPRSEGYKDGGGESDTLQTEVPIGGSVFIPYKGHYEGLSAAAFENGFHFVKAGGGLPYGFLPVEGHAEVVFDDNGATVTNTSDKVWPAGSSMEYKWDRSKGTDPEKRNTAYATPLDTVRLYTPASGSPAIGSGDGNEPYIDLLGSKRNAPSTVGAIEVA